MSNILTELDQILEARKQESADASYVASLYHKGLEKILKKVAEESSEVLMAAKDLEHQSSNENRTHLAGEATDLVFHLLILLHHQGLSSNDILKTLEQRFGISGHDEKASRQK